MEDGHKYLGIELDDRYLMDCHSEYEVEGGRLLVDNNLLSRKFIYSMQAKADNADSYSSAVAQTMANR